MQILLSSVWELTRQLALAEDRAYFLDCTPSTITNAVFYASIPFDSDHISGFLCRGMS